MRINKDKPVGRVLFIVEGARAEFKILKTIFCDILGYTFIGNPRNPLPSFIHEGCKNSIISVINTKGSNITSISDDDYLDKIFEMLINKYDFNADKSAIYYMFDRDPKSNKDIKKINYYIEHLKNPYENSSYKAGQLLMSYPSIESFVISNFHDTSDIRLVLGKDCKHYIAQNKDIQAARIDTKTLAKATVEFIKFLENEGLKLNIDDFSYQSKTIFERQNEMYNDNKVFKLFSMVVLSFLQLGIIEL